MFENLPKETVASYENLLMKSGSPNKEEAMAAQVALAEALTLPLRQGIVVGNTIADLFTQTTFNPTARIEYPIDFYRPENTNEFTAYTIPGNGKIPQRQVEGDYVHVPTYSVGNSIDWLLRYARDARWDIVSRALEVLEAGFVKKLNDDGWHVLQAAAFDRNILVNDANAAPGQFTKRLVSLMKLVMARNGGGNSASLNRARMTHLFVSLESLEDMRAWDYSEVDDTTRREIYVAGDTGSTEIFGVKIVALNEMGEGQEYQDYYQNVTALGAANNGMAVGDLEIVLGVDASHKDSFVQAIRQPLQVFADDSLHRSQRQGYYSWQEYGLAVLSSVRVLLGSL